MDQQDHIERIEEARMAAYAEASIREFVAEKRETILSHVIGLYRSRKITHDDAIGAIAGLTALDDLMQNLTYIQRRGDLSAQEEFTHVKD